MYLVETEDRVYVVTEDRLPELIKQLSAVCVDHNDPEEMKMVEFRKPEINWRKQE